MSVETADGFPVGGGEMGRLIQAFDWAGTSLGPLEAWPQSLRTATDIVLESPVPIVMLWGPDGVMIYNDAYSVFAAQRHPTLLGSKVLEGWPEVADFNAEVMRVCMAGGTLRFPGQELTLYRNNRPEEVWMNLSYSPVHDESGKPGGVIAIVLEITEQVLAERALAAEQAALRDANRHLQLLVNELNHRVKNTLSMMQAMAAQTFRNPEDLAGAQERFSARIMALAKANDLLTGENWEAASLSDVLEVAVRSHADGERLTTKGPPVRLSPKTAMSFSMAMHELATNAVKYGALSSPEGRVEVVWAVDPAPGGRRLRLAWTERNGPQVTPPARRGFGSRLIERGLAAELGGSVVIRFEPDGVVCTIDAPVDLYESPA